MATPKIQENVVLRDYTSIFLGGPARYFCNINSIEEIENALEFSKKNQLPAFILGGGSNCIFADSGYNGLILHNCIDNIEFIEKKSNDVFAKIGSGINWDVFVQQCCQKGYYGLECLSGIPGTIGAVPVQNVGAYGQEVAKQIVEVNTWDMQESKEVIFQNKDCNFSYRSSFFKKQSSKRYYITQVVFHLKKNDKMNSDYPELLSSLEKSRDNFKLDSEYLLYIRNKILQLRQKKSMVIDAMNPHSRSCGSFFMNPILNDSEWKDFQKIMSSKDIFKYPSYKMSTGIKIPAAFLIEQAGFQKGQMSNEIGISPHHALALVNYGGTTEKLLELRDQIQEKVLQSFNIFLETEPVIVT